MIVHPHINIPGPAVEEMRTKYGMSPTDISNALEVYIAEILENFDEVDITFFQFLKNDFETKRYYTHIQ